MEGLRTGWPELLLSSTGRAAQPRREAPRRARRRGASVRASRRGPGAHDARRDAPGEDRLPRRTRSRSLERKPCGTHLSAGRAWPCSRSSPFCPWPGPRRRSSPRPSSCATAASPPSTTRSRRRRRWPRAATRSSPWARTKRSRATSGRHTQVIDLAGPPRHPRLHRGPRPLHRRRRGAHRAEPHAREELGRDRGHGEGRRGQGAARRVDPRARLAPGEVEPPAPAERGGLPDPPLAERRVARTTRSSSPTPAATPRSPTRRPWSWRASRATPRARPAARS